MDEQTRSEDPTTPTPAGSNDREPSEGRTDLPADERPAQGEDSTNADAGTTSDDH